ncbi:PilX-like prepilin protein [Ureibacillus xyleni]|uniref:PilX-like prepilin protein n=1 Tax=Ureibacillus xyleni TaxID=614648 RepID=A0A285RIF9_9BACL|nr:pilus assembly PilX N-terminal domain-containing protein [Ureibacillus xyleni]SOB93906.1 PilX-like prepilin protein [Ureibacillus xyleni]
MNPSRNLNNDQGYILFIVLVTLTIISILGLTLITTTSNSLKTSSRERENQSLYYIAESGIVMKREKIKEIVYDEYKQINSYSTCQSTTLTSTQKFECKQKTFITRLKNRLLSIQTTTAYEDFEEQLGQVPVASVDTRKISETPTELIYEIISTGSMKNSTSNSRTLSQQLTISLGGGPDAEEPVEVVESLSVMWETIPVRTNYAVYSYGQQSLGGGATIIGKICSNTNNYSISGGSSVSGGVCSKTSADYNPLPIQSKLLPAFPTNMFTSLNRLPYPANLQVAKDAYNKSLIISSGNVLADNWITNNYTMRIGNDMKFNTFTVDQNNQITLDIGNGSRNVYINDFNIKQGTLNVVGSGELNLFVKNSFYLKGILKNVGDTVKINIYYDSASVLKFTNEAQLYANLYSKTANVEFTAGSVFAGNIYSGGSSIDISGGNSSKGNFIIAPYANVKLSGGGQIRGTVISNTLTASGGTSVTYSTEFFKQPPLPSEQPPIEEEQDDADVNLVIEDRIIER